MGARSSQSRGPGLNKSDGHLLEYFRQTFGAGGGGTNYVASRSGLTATGGVISDYTDGSTVYRAHIFTSSGTFDVTEPGDFGDTVEYLVVAGGGGAGSSGTFDRSGGGGAGGFRTNLSGHPLAGSPFPIPSASFPAPYTVTVGGGGAGANGTGPTSGGSNQNGSPSVFGPITSTAGGGGGSGHGTTFVVKNGAPGGSGGGGGYLGPSGGGSPPSLGSAGSGNTPLVLPSQGNDGGAGQGGGGGGAGGPGGAGPNGTGGAGSPIAIETNTAKTYAAGGKGGDSPPASAGDFSTGDGGDAVFNGNGYSGGSGIVVVRYQIGQLTATAKATGGAISYYNGKTIHTFTSSGTFATEPNWSPTNVEYVVVGGGGAGNGGPGPSCGGGGGAGGFITADNHPIGTHPVSVTVTIGAGAASAANTQSGGTPSSFGSPITAYGGGGGGRHINGGGDPAENGQPGGSGGGECDSQGPIGAGLGSRQTGTTTPTPITPQGNPGGAGAGNGGTNSVSGGGGGGAGQAGQNATDQGPGGDGGYGKQLPATFQNPASATSLGTSPNPTRYAGPNSGNYWFAGGGGGASSTPPSAFGLDTQGGLGGGGRGFTNPGASLPTARDEMDAIQNTGGGGGAFHGPAGGTSAGSGGSGIVIIAYPS